jgi:hypothetical protein
MTSNTTGQGAVAPVRVEEKQPTPNEKTILVCRPGGKWSLEVVA